ncbi:MAG: hypothetical protein IAI49_13980 [Candidatus Eremiobacteraeota bacterium]|nr:hypothetical protein [Candidatus Eremiobacteraeota bacterium]
MKRRFYVRLNQPHDGGEYIEADDELDALAIAVEKAEQCSDAQLIVGDRGRLTAIVYAAGSDTENDAFSDPRTLCYGEKG